MSVKEIYFINKKKMKFEQIERVKTIVVKSKKMKEKNEGKNETLKRRKRKKEEAYEEKACWKAVK